MHLTANPATHQEWYRAKIGQNAYNKLEHMHSKPAHYTMNDLNLLHEFYKSKLNVIMKSIKWVRTEKP